MTSRYLLALVFYTTLTFPLHGQQNQNRGANSANRPKPLAAIEDDPRLPRVLLIGDSISIGYTLPVRALLEGVANVHRPQTNCGPTTKGVAELETWLGNGQWDVIHFNFGLHDLKFMGPNGENLADPDAPTSRQQVPPEAYERNLRKIAARLKKTGAQLIWRNTTPVPPGAKGRVPGHSAEYNAIAERVMLDYGITIDDHYSFALENMSTIQRPANVHYTPEGSAQLAKLAATAIQTALSNDE